MRPAHHVRVPLALAAIACGGCVDQAFFAQGEDLSTLLLHPTSRTEGIFPDVSVLDDPANPFVAVSGYATDAVHNQDALQFKINATAAHAARFYIWATILARRAPEGDGEAQYYAATALRDVFFFEKAGAADLPTVRDMAVAGFSEVLTQFGSSAVTYDASGKIAYELLTPSLQGLLDLGGTAPTGWILIKDQSGMPRAVRQ